MTSQELIEQFNQIIMLGAASIALIYTGYRTKKRSHQHVL